MKTTKIVACMALIALALAACATSKTGEKPRNQDRALKAQSVRKALDDRFYTIDMTFIRPRRLPSKYLSSGYYLHISGDSIYSCLPYVGRAYNVPYGGGDGLDFCGLMQSYEEKRSSDGKGTKINIVVRNSEDRYQYMLYVDDNGRASLNVMPDRREAIAFDGEMKLSR